MNEKPWFKRRTFGWGWTPATPEGWAVVAVHALLTLAGVAVLAHVRGAGLGPRANLAVFLGWNALLTVALIGVCYVKGEALWRR